MLPAPLKRRALSTIRLRRRRRRVDSCRRGSIRKRQSEIGLQKRKRQKPKPLALSSLIISQREQIPSRAFRWPTLSACAECRVHRRCLRLSFRLAPSALPLSVELPACAFRSSTWLSFQLAPSTHPWLFRRPGFRLAPSACTLRPVRSPGFSRLASGTLVSGFLRSGVRLSSGARSHRPCAFDRLPASVVHYPLSLLPVPRPAFAFR